MPFSFFLRAAVIQHHMKCYVLCKYGLPYTAMIEDSPNVTFANDEEESSEFVRVIFETLNIPRKK